MKKVLGFVFLLLVFMGVFPTTVSAQTQLGCDIDLSQNPYGYLEGRVTLHASENYKFGDSSTLNADWLLTGIVGSSSGQFKTDMAAANTPIVMEFNHPNIGLPPGGTVTLKVTFSVDQGYYSIAQNQPNFSNPSCSTNIAVDSLDTFPVYVEGSVYKNDGGAKYFTNIGGCDVPGSLASNNDKGYTMSWNQANRSGGNMIYGCSTPGPADHPLSFTKIPSFYSSNPSTADTTHSNPNTGNNVIISVRMNDQSVQLKKWKLDVYNDNADRKGTTFTGTFATAGPNQTISFNPSGDGSFRWYNLEVYEEVITATPSNITLNLSVGPENSGQSGSFTGYNKTAGKTNDQSGSQWNNPLKITGSFSNIAPENVSAIYVAFYNKATGAALDNPETFRSQIISRLQNKKNGFLLRFEPASRRHSVWNGTGYLPLSSTRTNIQDESGLLYRVRITPDSSSSSQGTWFVTLDQGFGNKDMYTAIYAEETNGKKTLIKDVPLN